jgi:hypothetical protein
MARHVLISIYKERTGAVAVRAALESAVQVGRGDEGNRQAEMVNPTKCRDSLQVVIVFAEFWIIAMHRLQKIEHKWDDFAQ